MSERSIHLRDQAAKCRWHANAISDCETQVALRKLADEYVERAADIEGEEQERLRIIRIEASPPTRRESGSGQTTSGNRP